MNYAYLFIDNLDNHSYDNGLNEIKSSIFFLKKYKNLNDKIFVFNNEISGKNIDFFQNQLINHEHITLSRKYEGSDTVNPISILVEKIISLMNFNEDEDVVLMDIDTTLSQKIPLDYWDNNNIIFDNAEYPIMQWRNLDKVLPQIPWKQFDINFDSSFLMYNTGVIYIPKKFRKEICEKALKIVDYLNDNFDANERCGNKLDEQIALSIVSHDCFGLYGNIKLARDYITHHWDKKQNGVFWWELDEFKPIKFRLESVKNIANDSPDHLCPVGCLNDNSSSQELIDEVIDYFNGRKIVALDLGCAGGQFAIDFIHRGHDGIGLEGSSNVLNGAGKHNWEKYLNSNLFLCDLTEEYQLYENNIPLKVDFIHCEEVFEHIHPSKIDFFLQQIIKHLKDDGICCFGIGLHNHEVLVGDVLYVLHQSVFPAEWWKNKLIENGFEILKGNNNKNNYYGYIFNNVVRNDCSDSSCYFMVTKKNNNENTAEIHFDNFVQTKSYNNDLDLLSEGVSLALKHEKEDNRSGLWLEFGVFSGKTINFISGLNPNQTIFGFDSFYGLPEHWRDGLTVGCFSLDGNLPKVNENVSLIKGWFKDTLPTFLDQQSNQEKISFLHIDSDIYSSAKEILYFCHDRIIPGTIIIFDEFYNYPEYKDHEYKAWKEYCEDFGVRFKYLGHTNGPEFCHQVMLEILEVGYKNSFEDEKKLPLSVGILAWKSGETLRNTLNSYKKNGFFDIINDVTILFQECSDEDIQIAHEYNIPFINFEKNIGIGKGFVELSKSCKCDNILLLEHDWELIENKEVTFERLNSGIELLNSGVNHIRYRHRRNPGYPLYGLSIRGNEIGHYSDIIKLESPHLMECLHWIENPNMEFPDKISKKGENFITTSRWSVFTNNPGMYKKDFYINAVSQFMDKSLHLENDISYWWARQNFKVAWGEGLFKHNDIKKHGITFFESLLPDFFKKDNNSIAFICAHRETDVWSTPLSIVNEFKKLGWNIKIYSLFDSNDNYVDDNIHELLKSNPDIIIHMDFGQHTSAILGELKKTGAFCIMESGDDPQRFDSNQIKSPWFDLILSPDIRCVEKYKEMGYYAEWWTHFTDTDIYFPLNIEPKYTAVCSRGMGNSAFIIDSLSQKYPDQIKNQNGWFGSEHSKFLNSGKIVLQQSRYGEITRRIFEGMSCKKLVIADRLDLSTKIQELFVDGEDIVFYDDEVDCLNKIMYYSFNTEEAKKIAENGYNKVLKYHTQKQRVQFIIEKWKQFQNKH